MYLVVCSYTYGQLQSDISAPDTYEYIRIRQSTIVYEIKFLIPDRTDLWRTDENSSPRSKAKKTTLKQYWKF